MVWDNAFWGMTTAGHNLLEIFEMIFLPSKKGSSPFQTMSLQARWASYGKIPNVIWQMFWARNLRKFQIYPNPKKGACQTCQWRVSGGSLGVPQWDPLG